MQFFTNNRGGEIQSRLTNDIAAMRGTVTTTATSVASSLTMTVATLVAMVALTQIIFGVMPALIYLVAGLGPGITIGTLIAFSTLQTQIFRPITGLLNVGAQWVASMALFSRVFEYLDLEPELTEATEPAQLADASLTIPAHTTTALVGHTGSGKSTVATLLARPADPTEGAVLLDGVDLRDIPPEQRAEAISVVSQETYLLHGTVRENLLFAQPGASDEQMRAALNAARVDGVIAALPEGLDTVVGSRDYRFSGGERQRLSLARTLLRQPQVLILDEATSALDNETERAIQEAVLGADATRLVIAHRLSTIRDADQIVVLDAGRMVERGTHTELLARDGAYAALLRAASAADAS